MNKKQILEAYNDARANMKSIIDKAESENRTLTDEESAQFDQFEQNAKKNMEMLNDMNKMDDLKDLHAPEPEKLTVEQKDVKDFAGYVRSRMMGAPMAAGTNITKTDNGAIIPKTIADRIIDRVKDISPLYGMATKYNVKGNLSIPVVDASKDAITMAYSDEFTELAQKATGFKTVDLSGYLSGALALISRSLVNSTDIDLVNFVVEKMASAVATFYDTEILNGTTGKIEGLSKVEQVITTGAATAIKADELISLKNTLKSAYQNGACFVMNPATFTAVQQLKDNNGRYLFNDNIVEGFSGMILGKPVYTSDQMPVITAGKPAVFYINPAEALAVKTVEESVQVLTETYATQHAIGVVEWIEADAKVQNQQAVASLTMKTA